MAVKEIRGEPPGVVDHPALLDVVGHRPPREWVIDSAVCGEHQQTGMGKLSSSYCDHLMWTALLPRHIGTYTSLQCYVVCSQVYMIQIW